MSARYTATSLPRKGEVSMKEWVSEQARLYGFSESAIYMRIKRGQMARPATRRVNKRVVYVRKL